MCYYTTARISYDDDTGTVTPQHLLAAARSYLEAERAEYGIDDILADLERGLESGETTFSDLRCYDLTEMFAALSQHFPTITFYIWGFGEEPFDIWSRGFQAGEVIYEQGPFEE